MRLIPRKFLLQTHLWAGLTIGLVLTALAVSGAVLVWRPHLDSRVDSHLKAVTPGGARLSADELVARAVAAHPTAGLESVRYYGDPTAPFLVYFTNQDYVHLNPYTGEVLGVRKRYGDFFGWFEGFHKFLQLDPTVGENITGSVAIVFGAIIATGIMLWWPATRRALKAGLTLNPKLSGRPWNLNLHKTIGIYGAIVVFVSALTGVPIAFDWVKNIGLDALTVSHSEPVPVRPAAAGSRFVGFSAVSRKLAAMMPGATETYIRLPQDGVVSSYVIEAGASHPNARSYVWFNPADAAVLRATPYTQASRGFRLYYWLLSLHTGMIGGWFVQLLFFLGVLTVPVLTYTGSAAYLKRKFGRAPVKARGRPPVFTGNPAPANSPLSMPAVLACSDKTIP